MFYIGVVDLVVKGCEWLHIILLTNYQKYDIVTSVHHTFQPREYNMMFKHILIAVAISFLASIVLPQDSHADEILAERVQECLVHLRNQDAMLAQNRGSLQLARKATSMAEKRSWLRNAKDAFKSARESRRAINHLDCNKYIQASLLDPSL